LEKFNELLELLGCDPRKEEPQEVMEEPQEPEAPTEPENEPSPTILILAEGKLKLPEKFSDGKRSLSIIHVHCRLCI
jgi:hypothetical protein